MGWPSEGRQQTGPIRHMVQFGFPKKKGKQDQTDHCSLLVLTKRKPIIGQMETSIKNKFFRESWWKSM